MHSAAVLVPTAAAPPLPSGVPAVTLSDIITTQRSLAAPVSVSPGPAALSETASPPEVGDEVEKGEAFGAVESVKAASDVYAPISGEVVEINGALEDTPDLVNSSALEDGWFIKVKMSDAGEVDALMDEAAYAEHTKE